VSICLSFVVPGPQRADGLQRILYLPVE
jgi:hypothetical protein